MALSEDIMNLRSPDSVLPLRGPEKQTEEKYATEYEKLKIRVELARGRIPGVGNC